MGRDSGLDDLALLLGIGFIGALAYFEWYKGKDVKFIMQDVEEKVGKFAEGIGSSIKLPKITFPEIPTFQPPTFTPTTPTPLPTSTVPDAMGEPTSTEPAQKPVGSGQLAKNPTVSPPPSGSGGAIVAFAGDFDTNNTAKQTVQVMEKNNVSFVIGCGDYSYGPSASSWFDQIIGARYKGRFKGAQGNHDNDSYLPVFGQEKWNMVVKAAPNLAVVIIDTEGGISAGELDTLTTQAKGMAKHVAYAMHKPYITSSDGHHKGSENKSGSVIDAAAKKHGIKLVVSGHNHVYEHFMCNGIHYVTSGAAGRKFYKTGCKMAGAVKCTDNTNGFLKVSVGANLLCQFISNSGGAIDSFTIQ